jgi:hypothetical protein
MNCDVKVVPFAKTRHSNWNENKRKSIRNWNGRKECRGDFRMNKTQTHSILSNCVRLLSMFLPEKADGIHRFLNRFHTLSSIDTWLNRWDGFSRVENWREPSLEQFNRSEPPLVGAVVDCRWSCCCCRWGNLKRLTLNLTCNIVKRWKNRWRIRIFWWFLFYMSQDTFCTWIPVLIINEGRSSDVPTTFRRLYRKRPLSLVSLVFCLQWPLVDQSPFHSIPHEWYRKRILVRDAFFHRESTMNKVVPESRFAAVFKESSLVDVGSCRKERTRSRDPSSFGTDRRDRRVRCPDRQLEFLSPAWWWMSKVSLAICLLPNDAWSIDKSTSLLLIGRLLMQLETPVCKPMNSRHRACGRRLSKVWKRRVATHHCLTVRHRQQASRCW